MARSAATTVGSTGSECTVISGMTHIASVRSTVPRKSKALLDAEPAQDRGVIVGEMAEMVGAEDLPPAHGAAIPGRIAAEIAEIAGAGEIEMTGRGI